MSDEVSYNPNARSSYAKSVNRYIRKRERKNRNLETKSIRNCVIVDSFSGEENTNTTMHPRKDLHVWWVVELPNGERETVRCAHDYDYIMTNIGNVAAQIGRYATVHYRGNRSDISLGLGKIQPDFGARLPHPEADSTTLSIGALAGIMDDDDPLEKMSFISYSSENLGPKVS